MYRAIFELLKEDPHLKDRADGLSPKVSGALEELLEDPQHIEHLEQAFLDCLSDLEGRALQKRHEELKKDLEAETSEEGKQKVLKEINENMRVRMMS